MSEPDHSTVSGTAHASAEADTPLPAEFVPRSREPYDKAGRVTEPIACCKCGYNLIGLDLRGVCPECTEPVARSVVGNLLEFMPAERLTALHKRLGLVTLGTFASVLMPIIGGVIAIFVGMAIAGGGGMGGTASSLLGVGVTAINLTGLIVLCIAWFGLARTDGEMGETQLDRSAMRAGLFMLISYLAWLAAPFLTSGPGIFARGGLGVSGVLGTIGLVLYAVWIGFSAAYLWNAQHFLMMIASRAPDPLLAHKVRGRRLSSVLWWTLGLLVFFLGPLAAVSNLLASVQDVRFHTKRQSHARSGERFGEQSGFQDAATR